MLSSGALLAACDGDDDGGADTGPADTGLDSGVFDTGRPDSGIRPDSGDVDTGVPDTGVDNCLPNNTVDVDGTGVRVDEATTPPTSSGGGVAVLSCNRTPPPAFITDYCLVECVTFLGYTPSQAEVDELEFAAYALEDQTMNPTGADPTYDPVTGIDNDPTARAGIASIVAAPPGSQCDSGYQLEIGFTAGPGAGSESFRSEIRYVVRVRSTTAAPSWVDTYHYDFVRRNDQVPMTSNCGVDETRIPSRAFEFPVIHTSILEDAIAGAGAPVPGSADLFDGRGTGYVVIEARDCAGGGGNPMTNATVGTTPMPISDVYPSDTFALNRTELYTARPGLWFGVGFDAFTATSSLSMDVVGAVGVTSDGMCTEAFGGVSFPVWPDAVTYIRFNRETILD
jgi:hypothetical protein